LIKTAAEENSKTNENTYDRVQESFYPVDYACLNTSSCNQKEGVTDVPTP